MKKLLLAAIVSLTATLVHAQGTVSFVNSTTTKIITVEGAPVPTGNPSPYVASLWWGAQGAAANSLTQIATTQNWAPFNGVFSGGTVTFPVPGGTKVQLQVRVWAVADPNSVGHGPLQLITLGNAGSPPSPAASLVSPTTPGDTFFIVTTIPEPSSLVLGLLGLGAITLFRRRKETVVIVFSQAASLRKRISDNESTMKKLLLVAIASLTAAALHAQGTVSFVNSTTTKITSTPGGAPIPTGNPNPNWIAALWWGPQGTAESSLTLIATTQTWEPFSGVFSGGTVTFPVPGGTKVQIQVRAGSVLDPINFGGRGPLQLITLGNAGSPPSPAASLTSPLVAGDTPFSGFAANGDMGPVIPEPSIVTIGLAGLGAVILFRRRK